MTEDAPEPGTDWRRRYAEAMAGLTALAAALAKRAALRDHLAQIEADAAKRMTVDKDGQSGAP